MASLGRVVDGVRVHVRRHGFLMVTQPEMYAVLVLRRCGGWVMERRGGWAEERRGRWYSEAL